MSQNENRIKDQHKTSNGRGLDVQIEEKQMTERTQSSATFGSDECCDHARRSGEDEVEIEDIDEQRRLMQKFKMIAK